MIVNLTPHPIMVFNNDVEDRIDDNEDLSTYIYRIIPKSLTNEPLRLSEKSNFSNFYNDSLKIEYVEYGFLSYEPPQVADMLYVVSLATALAAKHRWDFVVPYREVRNLNGTVIGCRSFAKPC